MKCHRCSYEFQPFETACPRCAHLKKSTGTQKLNTQHLVHLDQCPYCKWLLFPTHSVCTSCGKPVDRSPVHRNVELANVKKSASTPRLPAISFKFSRQIVLDLGTCALVFGGIAVLFYLVFRGAQAAS